MVFSERMYEWKMVCSQRGEAKVTKFGMGPAGCVPCEGGVGQRVRLGPLRPLTYLQGSFSSSCHPAISPAVAMTL